MIFVLQRCFFQLISICGVFPVVNAAYVYALITNILLPIEVVASLAIISGYVQIGVEGRKH